MGACCSKQEKFDTVPRYDRDEEDDKICEVDEEQEDDSQIEDGGACVRLQGYSTYVSMFTQQGRKGVNQDAMTVWEDFTGQKDMFFCGVFDGHGPSGHQVSRLVRDMLPSKLSSGIRASMLNSCSGKSADADDSNGDDTEYDSDNNGGYKMSLHSWEAIFVKSFKEMDEELSLDATIDTFCSGATAVTLIKKGKQLVIANLGDSRAVLCTRDKKSQLIAEQLSVDLKPNVPGEADRIKSCHGRIFALEAEPHVFRVWMPEEDCPGLAMARSFGDFCLKDYGLISVPEVIFRKLTDKDEFLVLATDGIWDVLSNDEVIRIVASARKRSQAAQLLVNHAGWAWRTKYPTSRVDDCAAICLFLKDQPLLSKCMSDRFTSSEVHADLSISCKSRSAKSECGPAYDDTNSREKWSTPQKLSRVNSFFKFPRMPGALSRRKSIKDWQDVGSR